MKLTSFFCLLLTACAVLVSGQDRQQCKEPTPGSVFCACAKDGKQNFEVDETFPKNIIHFDLKNCDVVKLHNDTFSLSPQLETIAIENINDLTFDAILPRTISSLHMNSVRYIANIKAESFMGILTLSSLVIEHSTIGFIEPYSFTDMSEILQVNFTDVKFKSLPDFALSFKFLSTSLNTMLVFDSCIFEKIGKDSIRTNLVGVSFKNNVLNCNNIANLYNWVEQLFSDEIQENSTFHCNIFKENYCKKEKLFENQIIYKLFLKLDEINEEIGFPISSACAESYTQFNNKGSIAAGTKTSKVNITKKEFSNNAKINSGILFQPIALTIYFLPICNIIRIF